MEWNAIPALIIVGINLCVGVYYLLMFLRRREERADLTFTLACLSIAFCVFTCAGLYNSSTVPEGMEMQAWQKGRPYVRI